MLREALILSLLFTTHTTQAKSDLSLAESKKNLNDQEYMQLTHELLEKDRKKAEVTDYTDQLNTGKNKQGGNTLTVGVNEQCGFPTISAAIFFAAPGDTIFVADDLITGIDAKLKIDKSLTLVGGLDITCQVFTSNRTHLILGDFGPVIEVDVSGDKNVTISGFDISGAQHDNLSDYDGGIYVYGDGKLTISNSHIHDNESFFGGGITVRSGAELFLNENTEIYNNTAISDGGGIFCSSAKKTRTDAG